MPQLNVFGEVRVPNLLMVEIFYLSNKDDLRGLTHDNTSVKVNVSEAYKN